MESVQHSQSQLSNVVLTPLWNGELRRRQNRSLSLQMSQDVQDGVELKAESIHLPALVLSQTSPVLQLRLQIITWRLPRPPKHLKDTNKRPQVVFDTVELLHLTSMWIMSSGEVHSLLHQTAYMFGHRSSSVSNSDVCVTRRRFPRVQETFKVIYSITFRSAYVFVQVSSS